MRALATSFLTFSLSFLTACTGSIPTTLVASTSPIPAGVRGSVPAYGSNCQYYLLGLIPVSGSADSQEALDEAKFDANVDVLTDVTVDHGGGYYILFSNHCVRVRGKGVPRRVLEDAMVAERSGRSSY